MDKRQIDPQRSFPRPPSGLLGSSIIDTVPNRRWTVPTLFLIIIASVIMITSGSLSGAAAWANIFALPVAILGLIIALRGTGSSRHTQSDPDDTSSHAGRVVHQNGYTLKGDLFNVAGDNYVRGRRHPGGETR
jgi:hypothetical protein